MKIKTIVIALAISLVNIAVPDDTLAASSIVVEDTAVILDSLNKAGSLPVGKAIDRTKSVVKQAVKMATSSNGGDTMSDECPEDEEKYYISTCADADDDTAIKNNVRIFGIIGIFFFPIVGAVVALLVFLIFLRRMRADRLHVVELSIMEKQPLPKEFFYRYRSRNRRLQNGMMWLAWGFGLMIFFMVVEAEEPAALMSIPVFIGISKIITYVIERKRQRDDSDAFKD